MIHWLRRLLVFIIGTYARGRLLDGARRQGVLVYLRAVGGLRRLLVTLVVINLMLTLTVVSFAGLVHAATTLLVADETTRLYVLTGVFALTFTVPLLIGGYLLSQSFWLKLSGAEHLIGEPAGE